MTRFAAIAACALLVGVPIVRAFPNESAEVCVNSGGCPTGDFGSLTSNLSKLIIGDFENGLQGWTLHGSAQRVNTQVLGGEWAIFGDARTDASISIDLDLTVFRTMEFEQFYTGGEEFVFGFLLVFAGEESGAAFVQNISIDENPIRVDLSRFEGPGSIEILWGQFTLPDTQQPEELVGFIDNISLIPIPELSTLALLGIGLVGLALRRGRVV